MRFGAARGGQPRNDQKSELSSASDPFSEDIGRTPFELGDGFISGTDLLASIGEQADAAPPVTDADAFHFQSLSSAPGHSPAPASIGPENALEVSANGITSFLAREAADGGRIAELANALSDSQFAFVFRDDDFLRDRRNDEREPPLPDDAAGSGNEESDFDPAQDAAAVHSVNLIHTLTADHVGGHHNPDGHDHHGGHHHHGDHDDHDDHDHHDDHSHHDHDHLSAVEVALLEADFTAGAEGFTYADGTLGGAAPQPYAAGAWAGGTLGVTLGGLDNDDILDMSGGWTQSFTLTEAAPVTLSFDYSLTQGSEFEADEFSEVRYSLDGGAPVTVATITGDGNGGSAQTTGFQTYTTDLGTLAAGTHTITFGGFNNKKTYNDETTEVLIDNVLVTGDGPPPPAPSLAIAPVSADKAEGSGGTTAFTFEVTRSGDTSGSTSVDYAVTGSGGDPAEASDFGGSFPGGTVTFLAGETTKIVTVDVTADTDLEPDEGFTVTLSNATGGAGITTPTAAGTIQNDDVPVGAFNYIDADFSSGAEGFTYADSAFGGAVPQAYADGAWSSGVLGVTLGGIDDADILTISGGWSQSFTLAVPTALTLSFDYNLIQASGFESDEFSQVRYSVDGGASVVVASLTGDGDGGSAQTTGFQTFIADLGTLGAGTHTVTFGGFNNKKTFNDEVTEVLIDNVLVTGDAPPPPPAPSLAISPLSADKAEGSGGTTAFTFEVTRSGDTSGATSVDYAVSGSGGDPAEASDFGGSFPSGSVTFAAGETTKTVTVDVTADTDVEGDEGFTVTLSNASGGASISAPTATGTIQNDDAPPTTVLDEYFAGSENGTAGYDIWLDFEGTGWTVELQGAFIQAADYLTTVITGDIGGGGVVNGRVVDDLYMTAELTAIDGSGGILGQAGPTAIWTANDLSATGLMRFDTADAQNFANQGLWDDIVTHEMFHVVGFGTLWNFGQHGDLVSGSEYTGAAGLEAYRDTPGNGSATFIPVETEGGSGTAFSHWDEGALDNELMTGFIDNDGNPNTNDDNYLSEFSVMSLADLDYDVTYVDYPYDDGVSVG